MKLNLNELNDKLHDDNAADDDDDDADNKPPTSTYDIKYLGCTPIENKRSEKITSEAIKTVIANSKAGGRKAKNLKRVKLTVSPDGIDVCEHETLDTLMRYSIYKISYCSVDAAHDHMFSFVGSEVDPIKEEEERMSCYVFQCPKRKIAHEITLMVARCFENAYQHWRDAVVLNAKRQGINVDGKDVRKVLKEQNGGSASGLIESHVEVHQQQQQQSKPNNVNKPEDLLIDLVTVGKTDVREYLRNTWVSFEDDTREAGGMHNLVAC